MTSTSHAGDEIECLLQTHAPRDRFDPARTIVSPTIRKSILSHSAVEAIVLAADIRRSASILKESIDIPQYAHMLDDFVGEFRTLLSCHGGWFEKFTDDGFICYWLVENNFIELMDTVLDFSCAVMDNFRTYLSDELGYRLVPKIIATKEYPRGQESFAVEFHKKQR